MNKAYFIGLDIAKNIFQVFTADGKGKELSNRKMKRDALERYMANHPPATIGIEACGTAHHWARKLTEYGHTVCLIDPKRVKAFLGSRNKTDAADARAICEALMHPGTRFIRAKSIEQQDMDHLLARRERLVQNLTQLSNQTRSMLAERGIIFPKGAYNFMKIVSQLISERWDEFSGRFQATLTDNMEEYTEIQCAIKKLDVLIEACAKQSDPCRRLMKVTGIGPLIALALVSLVGEGTQFKNGRQMAAYFGLTPREHSSGGKQKLFGITKRGNRRLRTLFVNGSMAAITGLNRRKRNEDGLPVRLTALDRWILSLQSRMKTTKAAVALANKLTRIAWAVLARNERFDADKACSILKAA